MTKSIPLVGRLRSCMLRKAPNSSSGPCSSLPYQAADLIDSLYEALEEARRAINTLDEDAFGLVFDQHTGNPAYPVRDELLAKLAAVLSEASETLTEGGDAKQAPGDSLSGAVPQAGTPNLSPQYIRKKISK